MNPSLQEQLKLPMVSVHVAFRWQLFSVPFSHSFMSERKLKHQVNLIIVQREAGIIIIDEIVTHYHNKSHFRQIQDGNHKCSFQWYCCMLHCCHTSVFHPHTHHHLLMVRMSNEKDQDYKIMKQPTIAFTTICTKCIPSQTETLVTANCIATHLFTASHVSISTLINVCKQNSSMS